MRLAPAPLTAARRKLDIRAPWPAAATWPPTAGPTARAATRMPRRLRLATGPSGGGRAS